MSTHEGRNRYRVGLPSLKEAENVLAWDETNTRAEATVEVRDRHFGLVLQRAVVWTRSVPN
jgi:hypothetical protein